MPKRFSAIAAYLLSLAIGGAGGFVFVLLGLPLPWMLGAMCACTLAVFAGIPVGNPRLLVPPMTVLIGVMLGSAFHQDMFGELLGWIVPLLGIVVIVGVGGLASTIYYNRVAGLDLRTAYFAGMPGGMAEMTLLAIDNGADARIVALSHAARIMLVVSILPFAIGLSSDLDLSGSLPSVPGIADLSVEAGAFLVAIGVVGAVIGHLAGLSAKFLLGPMIVSAAAHLSGLTTSAPPSELVNSAQIVLGASIGCRFVGTSPRRLGRVLVHSLGSVLILMSLTLIVAGIVHAAFGADLVQMILAYAPGGLTEMSLVAVALHAEVAFVATHHVIRVALVTILAGFVFRLAGVDRLARRTAG